MTKKLLILSVLVFSVFAAVGCSGGGGDEGGTPGPVKPDSNGKTPEKGQNTAAPNVN